MNFLGDRDTKSYVNVKDIYPGIEIKRLECVGNYQKRVGTRLQNLKKKGKGIWWLKTSYWCYHWQTTELCRCCHLAKFWIFHVASDKDNSYHYPHCPIGSNSWSKYNSDRANNTQTYKPDLGLPRDIIYK